MKPNNQGYFQLNQRWIETVQLMYSSKLSWWRILEFQTHLILALYPFLNSFSFIIITAAIKDWKIIRATDLSVVPVFSECELFKNVFLACITKSEDLLVICQATREPCLTCQTVNWLSNHLIATDSDHEVRDLNFDDLTRRHFRN